MKNLVIISQHWKVYKTRFEANHELQKHFVLLAAGEQTTDQILQQVQVMIGEPNLIAKCILTCPKLEWVQSTWAGNNALQALTKQDYQLTGVKGVFGLQMVEYILSYLLYFTRRIEEFNELKTSQKWSQLPCNTLSSYSIGIMGFGSIGQELAQRLLQFGMTVNGLSRNKKQIADVNEYTYQELPEFLSRSDYVVNLLPETEITTGICNRQFFKHMKKGSVFINAGRGSAIDSPTSIIDALTDNWIKAAVLDVFEQEPLPKNHPYYSTKNLYISCHTAAISNPQEVFDLFEKNADLYIKGMPLRYIHDFAEGY
jgi:phosphoglycerate dehydrogenase-like enzyme